MAAYTLPNLSEMVPRTEVKHRTLDEMVMDEDGFAGFFPEDRFEIVKRPGMCFFASVFIALCHSLFVTLTCVALSRVLVINASRSLTEPNLYAIGRSRVILQCMRKYTTRVFAVTVRIIVCSALLVFCPPRVLLQVPVHAIRDDCIPS